MSNGERNLAALGGVDPETGADLGIVPDDIQPAIDDLGAAASQISEVQGVLTSAEQLELSGVQRVIDAVNERTLAGAGPGLQNAMEVLGSIRTSLQAGQNVLVAQALSQLQRAGAPILTQLISGQLGPRVDGRPIAAGQPRRAPARVAANLRRRIELLDLEAADAAPGGLEGSLERAIVTAVVESGVADAVDPHTAGELVRCITDTLRTGLPLSVAIAECERLIEQLSVVEPLLTPPSAEPSPGESPSLPSGAAPEEPPRRRTLTRSAGAAGTPIGERDPRLAGGFGGGFSGGLGRPQTRTPRGIVCEPDDPQARRVLRVLEETGPGSPERTKLLAEVCDGTSDTNGTVTPAKRRQLTRARERRERVRDLMQDIVGTRFAEIREEDLQRIGSCSTDFLRAIERGDRGFASSFATREIARLFRPEEEEKSVIGNFKDSVIEFLGGAGEFAIELLAEVIAFVPEAALRVTNLSGCNDDRIRSLVAIQSVVGFIDQWFAPGLARLVQPLDYQIQTICPTELPTASEAITGWLGGEFSTDDLVTLAKGNNKCEREWLNYAASQRNKLSPGEIITAWLRRKMTRSEADAQLRNLGYTDERDRDTYFEISEQLPFISDLIRFMVRDVDDPEVVEKFRYDEDFEAKFQSTLRDLTEQQGVTAETMRLYWRAHWQIPAFGQLAEMFHRSRSRSDSDPLKTTLADITEALKVNDVAPGWVDRLIDTTFRLVGRRDSRRLLRTFVWSHEDFEDEMKKQGFPDPVATALADEAVIDARRQLRNQPAFKQLSRLEISESFARKQFERDSIPAEEADQLVDEAMEIALQETNEECRKATAKRFESFEISEEDLERLGRENGLDGRALLLWKRRAVCARAAKGKEFSLGLVKQLFNEDLLTDPQAIERIERIGYSNADAVSILALWQDRIDAREAKEAEKERKRREAALKKAAAEEERRRKQALRAREKARKELTSARQKQEKNIERARKAKDRADERRAKMLMRIVEDCAKAEKIETDDCQAIVTEQKRRIKREYSLDEDNALRALAMAVDAKASAPDRDLIDRIDDAADAVESLIQEESIPNNGDE